MTEEKNPPDFEHADHPEIWDKVHENSKLISNLQTDMDWVKRILTGVFVAICITLISLIISML